MKEIETNPTAQIAHLVFTNTQNANSKNQKRYFFLMHVKNHRKY